MYCSWFSGFRTFDPVECRCWQVFLKHVNPKKHSTSTNSSFECAKVHLRGSFSGKFLRVHLTPCLHIFVHFRVETFPLFAVASFWNAAVRSGSDCRSFRPTVVQPCSASAACAAAACSACSFLAFWFGAMCELWQLVRVRIAQHIPTVSMSLCLL